MRITLKYIGIRHSSVIRDIANHEIIVYRNVFTEVSLSESQIRGIIARPDLFEVKPFRIVESETKPVRKKTHKRVFEWDGSTFNKI